MPAQAPLRHIHENSIIFVTHNDRGEALELEFDANGVRHGGATVSHLMDHGLIPTGGVSLAGLCGDLAVVRQRHVEVERSRLSIPPRT